MKRWSWILAIAVAMALGISTSGCQVLPKILPVVADVITEIIDAQNKVAALDAVAQSWFEKYPNEAMQKKWDGVMDKVKATIDVALKAAHGVEDAAEADVMGAMQNFVQAWAEARELALSIGFMGANGTMNAGPGAGTVLEEPLAVQRSRGAP
jgi:hypothetical protein